MLLCPLYLSPVAYLTSLSLPERSSYAIDGDSRNLVTELLQDRQNTINDHNKPSNEGPSGSNATTNALNDLLKYVLIKHYGTTTHIFRFVNSTFADAELHDKIINEVTSLLTSSRSTDDISSALVDTLGFDAFDVISIVLANRAELARVLADVVSLTFV